MRYRPNRRRRARWPFVVIGFAVVGCLASLAFSYAYETDERVAYRVDEFQVQLYRLFNAQGDTLPTPVVAVGGPITTQAFVPVVEEGTVTPVIAPPTPTPTPEGPTATPLATSTPTLPPTPIPGLFGLAGFRHEYQKANNCGPAALAVTLSYWGWEGTQADTAAVLKPVQADKNVSPIEIYNYLARIGYDAYIRNNGTLDTLKRFIAAGYPVLVEKGFQCGPDEGSRCEGWFGHYSVFTGYDDEKGIFIVQDTFRGPNQKLKYEDVLRNWRAFNYLYVVPFPASVERDAQVQALLGPEVVDLEQNYRAALQRARDEIPTLSGQDLAFAWFNVGTNLYFLKDYEGSAKAYDEARKIGLPYRMTWYQFGPYRSYYFMGRYQDVIDLATFAIKSTPKPGLEEAFYWRGLAYEATGQRQLAIEDYKEAVTQHPGDVEATDALKRLGLVP